MSTRPGGHRLLAGKVDDLGALRRLKALPHLGDALALNQNVGNAVEPQRRVDDMGTLKKQGPLSAPPSKR